MNSPSLRKRFFRGRNVYGTKMWSMPEHQRLAPASRLERTGGFPSPSPAALQNMMRLGKADLKRIGVRSVLRAAGRI